MWEVWRANDLICGTQEERSSVQPAEAEATAEAIQRKTVRVILMEYNKALRILDMIALRKQQIAELEADPTIAVVGYETELWMRKASLNNWQRRWEELQKAEEDS